MSYCVALVLFAVFTPTVPKIVGHIRITRIGKDISNVWVYQNSRTEKVETPPKYRRNLPYYLVWDPNTLEKWLYLLYLENRFVKIVQTL